MSRNDYSDMKHLGNRMNIRDVNPLDYTKEQVDEMRKYLTDHQLFCYWTEGSDFLAFLDATFVWDSSKCFIDDGRLVDLNRVYKILTSRLLFIFSLFSSQKTNRKVARIRLKAILLAIKDKLNPGRLKFANFKRFKPNSSQFNYSVDQRIENVKEHKQDLPKQEGNEESSKFIEETQVLIDEMNQLLATDGGDENNDEKK